MPNTVIMGSMCYSGWQSPLGTGYTPIETSFMNRNPISYYGFAFDNGLSAPVSVGFAKDMEDSLATALAVDLDSTKIANLSFNHMCRSFPILIIRVLCTSSHFGADDYSYERCGATLVDTRDGQKYATVCIGDQIWMAQNLNYYAPGSSDCINDSSVNCNIYGKLYDWPTLMQGASSSTASPSGVQGVCPNGWHVPSLNEFDTLINNLGGNGRCCGRHREIHVARCGQARMPAPPNSSGFSALPASFGFADGQFVGLGRIQLFLDRYSKCECHLIGCHLFNTRHGYGYFRESCYK